MTSKKTSFSWACVPAMAILSVVYACSNTSSPIDTPPGDAPSEATFSTGAEMSGFLFLELTEIASPGEQTTERLAFTFLPTSSSNGSVDVWLNALEFQRSELASLFAGETVTLVNSDQLIGAGNYTDDAVMDITDLSWYAVRTVSLDVDSEGLTTLHVALRTASEGIEPADESVSFDGLIQVACRPSSGQQDPQFATPFCSGVMQDMPELSALGE